MRRFFIILTIVVVILLLRMSVYTVDASEYVYVTVLGRHVATHDGAGAGAGLHVDWPWPVRTAHRLDRRLQSFDLPPVELLTPDKDKKAIDKKLSVEACVYWRVADADSVERFIQSLGTVERAQSILRERFHTQLGALIGRKSMDDLISTAPGGEPGRTRVDDQLDQLQGQLMKSLGDDVKSRYGIELVDVRLRRFSHVAEVRNAIFDRIRSERQKKAAEYRSEGERQASEITSNAEREAKAIENQAKADEKRIRGQADAEAANITSQAYAKDPQFHALLKSLENLETILKDNRTLLLLSTKHPLFELLLRTPQPGMPNPPGMGPVPPPDDPKKDADAKKGGA
jgi:membrane protease subunit HflC